MLKFVPYILQALFIIGGVALGAWAKSLSAAAPAEPAAVHASESHEGDANAKAMDAHGGEKKSKTKPAKDAGHGSKKSDGHSGGGADANGEGLMKFSRQFVVPVMNASGVGALVVVELNIEVPPNMTESIYAREPKLRDALLMTLFSLSNEGAFNEKLLDGENLGAMRKKLLASARTVIGEDAVSILILGITRQDV